MMFKVFTVLIHVVNLLTMAFMIFKEKRSTNSIIAWILILYLAPYVGFIVFILIGRKMNNANMFGFKNAELNTFKSEYDRWDSKSSDLLFFFIYMQNQYKTNRINTPCLFFDINNVNLNYRRPEDL